MRNLIQVPRRRVIAAVVILIFSAILTVILAVVGYPAWWIVLVFGVIAFFSLILVKPLDTDASATTTFPSPVASGFSRT